jgi:S-DNA-T family DNA segregation ATPase FtsK/SpoIIIE
VDVCDECQYRYESETVESIPGRLRTLGGRFAAPLSRFLPGEDGHAILRAHPVEDAWSALEYACHVRDVLDVNDGRVRQTMIEDVPTYEPMGRDERVLDLAYNEQDPKEVATAIAGNADALATTFEGLTAAQWERTGMYGYPGPAERSMLWVGQHTIHEVHHHLLDVGRTMRAARGR